MEFLRRILAHGVGAAELVDLTGEGPERWPAQHRDNEDGQHLRTPGVSADGKAQRRQQYTDEPDHGRAAQPRQVLAARVAQRHKQQAKVTLKKYR